jgi:hypothetical protein
MHDPTGTDGRGAGPPRSSGLIFVGLLAGAVMVTMLVGQLTDPGPPRHPTPVAATATTSDLATAPEPPRPIGVESIRECPVHLGGLVLGDHLRIPGSALERWDCDALSGPWSLVVRATGGHFGVHSAVVTFPVDLVGSGVPSTRPEGGVWNPGSQTLIWPLNGSHAQIVGDLSQTTLENLATRVTIAGGRPRFSALEGFVVAAATPYRSLVVHEMRYSTDDLGTAGRRGGGLIYTGVTLGASFETMAFEAHAKPAGLVRGKPAIFSDVPSGDGALAWESGPAEVTYIGTEGMDIPAGMATPADAIKILRSLADKGRVLTPEQWETKDRVRVAGP